VRRLTCGAGAFKIEQTHGEADDSLQAPGQNLDREGAMQSTATPKFTYRQNEDGSRDSICMGCLVTVASVMSEGLLARHEATHVCNPIRLYQLGQRDSQSSL
jgi:hypothetical protein